MKSPMVVGIDPGINGAFVAVNGKNLEAWPMPLAVEGKEKRIHFEAVVALLKEIGDRFGDFSVFVEKPTPFGLGAKSAFSYGRGYEALTIALELTKRPVTFVEPGKWTKEMHEGISSDMKPKVKSFLAVKRLFPHLVAALPKKPKGGLHDGMVDALLIAEYGYRRLAGSVKSKPKAMADFY